MPTDTWIAENLYDDWGQQFRVRRELARVRSPYQDILIIDTASHGRVMMLDGVVQITERDEFAYQEMLAHVPLIAHGDARRVLVIGAGDGGVLRRVLEHANVNKVVMVEIDGEVVRLSREFVPDIAGDAWHDERAEVIIGDGIDYVARSQTASFDVIIVDSTDPVGVGEALFTDRFYQHCSRVLADGGIIVNQCGVPSMQADELRDSSARRARHFPRVSAYLVAVPTYVGGFMALGIASKGNDWVVDDVALVTFRAENAGILNRTRYWSPEMHAASFALPPYIRRHLPG